MRFSLVWLQALETEAANVIHQASSQEMRNNRVRKSNFKLQGYIYQVFLTICAEPFGLSGGRVGLVWFFSLFSPLFCCIFFGQPPRHMAGGLDHCKALLFVTYLLMQGWGQQEETNVLAIVHCFFKCCSCCHSRRGQTFGTNSLAN